MQKRPIILRSLLTRRLVDMFCVSLSLFSSLSLSLSRVRARVLSLTRTHFHFHTHTHTHTQISTHINTHTNTSQRPSVPLFKASGRYSGKFELCSSLHSKSSRQLTFENFSDLSCTASLHSESSIQLKSREFLKKH